MLQNKRKITTRNGNRKARNKCLNRANSENIKLFAIISHDILSPLNSIEGYLNILSDTLQVEERCTIEKELLHLTNGTKTMLSNLLIWSNAQLNGIRSNIQPLNLAKVLSNLLEVKTDLARKKGIRLTVQLNGSIEALADKDMLQIVVRNLISNAIKFTNPGGLISVQGQTCHGKYIVSITDTGIGIPTSIKDKIFSLQQTTAGTMNEKGAGLGLLLCKEFIELQRGKIWCDTSENGTTFYLSLPTVNSHISVNTEKSSAYLN